MAVATPVAELLFFPRWPGVSSGGFVVCYIAEGPSPVPNLALPSFFCFETHLIALDFHSLLSIFPLLCAPLCPSSFSPFFSHDRETAGMIFSKNYFALIDCSLCKAVTPQIAPLQPPHYSFFSTSVPRRTHPVFFPPLNQRHVFRLKGAILSPVSLDWGPPAHLPPQLLVFCSLVLLL